MSKDARIKISLLSDGGYNSFEEHRIDVTQWMAILDVCSENERWRVMKSASPLLAAAIRAMDECVDLLETPAGNELMSAINSATGEAP